MRSERNTAIRMPVMEGGKVKAELKEIGAIIYHNLQK